MDYNKMNYAKEKEWVLITTDDLLTLRNIKKNKKSRAALNKCGSFQSLYN